ncbi:MAG: hypothetical protein A3K09_02210 [Nitrospinae bacterium RIFCSPLOWO2_12_FULL_47_7]|nr:MAG: hypothetical protein A3K09_02210 [Nitrospinae bacterium RIFCSPLOWO2_12_FULL_47_7]
MTNKNPGHPEKRSDVSYTVSKKNIGTIIVCLPIPFLIAVISLLMPDPFMSITHAASECGDKVRSVEFYQQVSLYSLIVGFSLFFSGILADKKKLKTGLWALAFPVFAVWGYVNYMVNFEQIHKTIFTYNVQAESALANIAEGQERYKSEHGTYLSDLNKMYSHLAGAHGVDPCVRILELKVTDDSWSATAQHMSSPDKIYWDGKSGSTLKKG